MRHLRRTSYGITMLGLVMLLAAVLFDLNPTVQLTGLMLALAGVVKIIVVYLWTHVANLGNDHHEPIPPT